MGQCPTPKNEIVKVGFYGLFITFVVSSSQLNSVNRTSSTVCVCHSDFREHSQRFQLSAVSHVKQGDVNRCKNPDDLRFTVIEMLSRDD